MRTLLFTETFNQADVSPVPAPWEVGFTGGGAADLQIVSNRLRGTSIVVDNIARLTAPVLPMNQWAEMVLAFGAGVSTAGLVLRGPTLPSFTTGYLFLVQVGGTPTSQIYELGGEGVLVSESATTWVSGDVLRVEAEEQVLRFFRNGGLVLQTTHATWTSGQPSVLLWNDTDVANCEADDFKVGNFVPGMPGGSMFMLGGGR